MKLHELHINDFKFFSEVESDSPLLKIDGNHLLVYGENGSGKSTIYWSLYTLLECSFKNSDDDIRKYFKKTGDESLVNIHATGANNTYIKTILKNAAGNSTTYRVSRKSRDLSIRINTDIRESNMASDFINYRVLFQLHNSKHSNKNNLWNWFYEEVLPYVKKGSNPCLLEFEALINGPDKVLDLQGDLIFPTALLRNASTLEERRLYRNFRDYKQNWTSWYTWFETFLANITARANVLISQDFKYNFRIALTVNKKFPDFQAPDHTIKWTNPEINISIVEYQGIQNPSIKKPHTFLNEARWSAIGLSLRLAILETRLYVADLKILVIDDMILSLDMSNREAVLELILNNYINDYQLILMTHDRFFFEMAKYSIEKRGIGNFKYLEMFEDLSGVFPKPLIIENTSQINKAWQLFHRKEFALAANTLRKASEKLCKAYLTAHERLNTTSYTVRNLHSQIEAFQTKGHANGLNTGNLTRFIEYKDRILNPSSHWDIETPLFKAELKRAIETVEALAVQTGINV
jgi:energy-coupling factor transporter ATP-binding protein EcfA2